MFGIGAGPLILLLLTLCVEMQVLRVLDYVPLISITEVLVVGGTCRWYHTHYHISSGKIAHRICNTIDRCECGYQENDEADEDYRYDCR